MFEMNNFEAIGIGLASRRRSLSGHAVKSKS
jgi:hypothetical protein